MNEIVKPNTVWWHAPLIVSCTLSCSFFLFYLAQSRNFFTGLILPFGEIGYNFYQYNSIKVNAQRIVQINKPQIEEQRLIDYADISDQLKNKRPDQFRSVNDTVGYGVLLGVIWKITHSLRYRDVQILQIFLFCLSLLLLYLFAKNLFASATCALLVSLAQLAFLPLVFLTIQPIRDIWAYYGLLVMLYLFCFPNKKTLFNIPTISGAFFFALCQWMRPTIFFSLFAAIVPIYVYRKSVIKTWCLFFACNVFLFWAPFIAYNKIAYDRYFVSPAGQDLYEGLGEFPNSWGIKMDDAVFGDLLQEKYGLEYGTPEGQDKGIELFYEKIKQHPLEYIWQIIKRIPLLMTFSVSWFLENKELDLCKDIPVIGFVFYFLAKAIGFILARCYYSIAYILVGWLGTYLAFCRGKKYETMLIITTALSCASKMISHFEPRYQVPHYAFFSVFVGYVAYEFLLFIQKKRAIYSSTRYRSLPI